MAMTLFKDTLTVVNVGLEGFADDIVAAGGACVALEWQPPAQGDRDGAWALADNARPPARRSRQRHRAGALHRRAAGADRRRAARATCCPAWRAAGA